MRFQKSEVLKVLSNHQKGYTIPSLVDIYYTDFRQDKHLKILRDSIYSEKIVVRSSSEDEDGEFVSNAGRYESILNVNILDDNGVNRAIQNVFDSYDSVEDNSRVLIQEMIIHPAVSGVLFTYEIDTGSPYYVVNYDDVSRKTDTVTAGNSIDSNKILYVLRNSIEEMKSKRFSNLLNAVKKIESFFNLPYLDVEFAIDEKEDIYIFQVRPITRIRKGNSNVLTDVDKSLIKLKSFLKNKFVSNPFLSGETTIFGQMPDWNPAEMIGSYPNNLAYSIYAYLITDNVWSLARKNMGYRSTTGFQLMIKIAGRPYIDTRLSFNSFLPERIKEVTGDKIVDIWLKKLNEHPNSHDKIEFDIAITCYSFNINEVLQNTEYDSLTSDEKEEYKKCLRDHLNRLIQPKSDGSLDKAIVEIEKLVEAQKKYNLLEFKDINLLLNQCKEYGTLPFSILARHGFIAKTLLLSIASLDIITNEEANYILGTIKTVSTDFLTDVEKCKLGKIKFDEFLEVYGHLRPGSYDLNSKPYREMFDDVINYTQRITQVEDLRFSRGKKKRITELFIQHGIKFTFESFYQYLSDAIKGREYGKFIFSKNLDKTLTLIKDFGNRYGIDGKKLVELEIADYFNLNNIYNNKEFLTHLGDKVDAAVAENEMYLNIKLPHLISKEDNLNIIPFQMSLPNFITQKEVFGPLIVIGNSVKNPDLINDKIVVIEGADPGYDWIFGYNITGLITKFGGANSHMAIRCNEFGIPAAIGCGELIYNKVVLNKFVKIDCKTKKITF